jgi:hypothetical protein
VAAKRGTGATHILVCFLAYVLWEALERPCSRAGPGDEPRRAPRELSNIQLVDVILPTNAGVELKRSCLATSTEHQRILLERLGPQLPTQWAQCKMNEKTQ